MYTYHKQQILIDEQQVTESNDIFDLAVTHPPLDVTSEFATIPGMNRTHSSGSRNPLILISYERTEGSLLKYLKLIVS